MDVASLASMCSKINGVTGVLLATLVSSLIKGASELGKPDHYPPDRFPTTNLRVFDFVVVGAGTAGSVVAARLSEVPQFTVAVLEAGGDPPSDSDVPNFFHESMSTNVDWQFRTEPQDNALLGFIGRRSIWSFGKMVGGSSSLGTMLYNRGNRRDYDHWAALGNPGWDFNSVLPYFKKSEDVQEEDLKSSPYHGTGGPMPVSYFEGTSPLAEATIDALQGAGLPLIDLNGENNLGIGRTQSITRKGVRFNAAHAFLSPVKNRKNLYLFKKSHVTRIVFQERRAIGVEFLRDGVLRFIRARKEVILCAGAINSPQLLMLSGIGPERHLSSFNIPVIYNSPGVGENLQDHMITFGQVISIKPQPKLDPLDQAYEFFKHRRGPLSNLGIYSALGNICTKYCDNPDDPDIELIHYGPLSKYDGTIDYVARVTGFTDEMRNVSFIDAFYKNRDVLLNLIDLSKPLSRGHIELQNSNPFVHPKIFANYFTHPRDIEVMAQGLLWGVKFSTLPEMQQFDPKISNIPIPGCTQFDVNTLNYWKCLARHLSSTGYDVCGTCKMGPRSDPLAVVDSELKVYGVSALRVVDASIMPRITSSNLIAPVLMIGEKASDMIKKLWLLKESNTI